MAPAQTPIATELHDALVSALLELAEGGDSPSTRFHNAICEAVCGLTSMRRAGIFLYDPVRHAVFAEGSAGVDPALLEDFYVTLDEAPAAQRALAEDRVVEVSDPQELIPLRYGRFAGVVSATCTPVAAGGRWLGVIVADRAGDPFSLDDDERGTMWALGKVAALAASAEMATRHRERSRQLAERVGMARRVHDDVVQRLFGVSLALEAAGDLEGDRRERCARELREAIRDLRGALLDPSPELARPAGRSLREGLELARNRYPHLRFDVDWPEGISVPAGLEGLTQAVLSEAVVNAARHARPGNVAMRLRRDDRHFSLELRNDGVDTGADGRARGEPGMGLRLAAFDALRHGGRLDYGSPRPGEWSVRLEVPVP
jgi:signal transduction histidine kinase